MVAIGFALFFLGGAAMDSDRLFVPILMVLCGITLIYVGGRRITWTK